jgi:predicted Zn-dependent peptidase
MSSRLFTKLRDEMGACYYIHANIEQYSDYGLLAISTGINAARAEEVTRVLLEECQKLSKVPVALEELQKAKEHHVGHLYMDLETTDSMAEFYANQEVITRKLKTPQELEKEIRKVTAQDVLRVAQDLFRDDKVNLAIVGNISDQKVIKKALTFK